MNPLFLQLGATDPKQLGKLLGRDKEESETSKSKDDSASSPPVKKRTDNVAVIDTSKGIDWKAPNMEVYEFITSHSLEWLSMGPSTKYVCSTSGLFYAHRMQRAGLPPPCTHRPFM